MTGTPAHPAIRSARTERRAARVLVVDDERNIRLLVRATLEADGHTVAEAPDGVTALGEIRAHAYDLMVLDLNMPSLDGLGVLQRLADGSRATAAPPAPRAIVLTAHGSIARAVRATQLGALDFLEKPVTPEELRAAVDAVLTAPEPAAAAGDDALAGGYAAVISRVSRLMRLARFETAETLLMKAADLGHADASYYNLLGVLYEVRKQHRLARKFYGKAIRADRNYAPAQQNMRRLFELHTFGHTREACALGDESDAWYAPAPRRD